MKPLHKAHRGFTLIELLVAVAIGLALTLAITTMLIRSESGRRSLTSTNDASNNGAFLSYTLDRTLRSAGSSFAQSWRNAYGCPLQASRAGLGTFLPRGTAYPPPFDAAPVTLRLAPVVVQAGAGTGGSDLLTVLTGASALGETPLTVRTGSADASSLRVPITLGMREGDLLAVLQEPNVAGNPRECLLEQVEPGYVGGADDRIRMGGNYYASNLGGVNLANIGSAQRAWVALLGNEVGNRPSFQMLGVAANNTLVAYDLLRMDGTDDVVPVADGVVDMRARYGVDTDDDGRVNAWVNPADAAWSAATLLDGSAASTIALSRIVSVRVALVMRNATPEKAAVTPPTLTLFDGLPAALQLTHTVADTRLRYRVLDFTVPLRNATLTQRP